MTIETKFNHGQRVQAITYAQDQYEEMCPACQGTGKVTVNGVEFGCGNEFCWGEGYIRKYKPKQWFVPKDAFYNFVIQKINTETYNPKNRISKEYKDRVWYMAGASGTMFYEEELFLTEKEAQEECDRRNKQLENGQ